MQTSRHSDEVLLVGVVCRLLLHTCIESWPGAFLRSCRTSILRLMLHVEWSYGSQPWINFLHLWTETQDLIYRLPLQAPK
ncbi:hypothetical protein CHARACLAT_031773 [Characodon lateralis]|uniref:Secreted protein n=1 Tax=Characodon lateralis TaxID=208331 RepID=A0ABU7DNU1_9TELE|nr:hypothetical protein [Characodon lateralis]